MRLLLDDARNAGEKWIGNAFYQHADDPALARTKALGHPVGTIAHFIGVFEDLILQGPADTLLGSLSVQHKGDSGGRDFQLSGKVMYGDLLFQWRNSFGIFSLID